MSETTAFLLGLMQGITEWIPLSSQGIITLASTWLNGLSAPDAIAIALWLHTGTALSAAIAIRRDITAMFREWTSAPTSLSAPLRFLIISTIATGIIGAPLYAVLGEIADLPGTVVMLFIGLAMTITAFIGWGKPWGDLRGREDVRDVDAVFIGVAQGLAVIPGLSRTGLTMAALLARGCNQREAVLLSVLMGIPASLGAGLLAVLSSDVITGWAAFLGMMTAAVVGTVTIHVLLKWSSRISFAPFVATVGSVVAAGALIGLLA